MRLHTLKLAGFRNWTAVELDFSTSPNIVAFVGKNAQGKTNLLEAIYLCALSRSFRTVKNHELIEFGASYSTVKAMTDQETLEVIITQGGTAKKTLKVNGVIQSAAAFIGHLKAVFFSPDDLAFMAFAPKLRRRYLDVLLSQLEARYLEALIYYEAARKQRNALLKRIKNREAREEELMFWDHQLSTFAPQILQARQNLVKELIPLVAEFYRSISDSKAEVTIDYRSTVSPESLNHYLKLLNQNLPKDLAAGKTTLGPQADDLDFFLDEKPMRSFSSRGEWRSLVLAMKFAEIELIKRQTGEAPILLLDDVFSELDAQRQKYLLEVVGQIQTFITTTHHELFETLPMTYELYEVEQGKIKPRPR